MAYVSVTDIARDCILELQSRGERVFEVEHDEEYGSIVEVTRDGHEVIERAILRAVKAVRDGELAQ